MTNEYLDIDGVKNKFGVGPELIIDYLTIIGDKADNIPGVEKVGPKTALKWLNAVRSWASSSPTSGMSRRRSIQIVMGWARNQSGLSFATPAKKYTSAT